MRPRSRPSPRHLSPGGVGLSFLRQNLRNFTRKAQRALRGGLTIENAFREIGQRVCREKGRGKRTSRLGGPFGGGRCDFGKREQQRKRGLDGCLPGLADFGLRNGQIGGRKRLIQSRQMSKGQEKRLLSVGQGDRPKRFKLIRQK